MTYGSSSSGIRQLHSGTSIGVIYVPISGGTGEGAEVGRSKREVKRARRVFQVHRAKAWTRLAERGGGRGCLGGEGEGGHALDLEIRQRDRQTEREACRLAPVDGHDRNIRWIRTGPKLWDGLVQLKTKRVFFRLQRCETLQECDWA